MDDNLVMLYLGERDLPEDFSQAPGMTVHVCPGPEQGRDLTVRPDIVLMDPFAGAKVPDAAVAGNWLEAFNPERYGVRPGIFCLTDPGTKKEILINIMDTGVDRTVEWPPSPREIRVKAGLCLKTRRIALQLKSDRTALEKSFNYLDRFKAELRQAKSELIEEKTSLNTALKQLQKMTQERRRLKQQTAELKDRLAANMEGFNRILTALIRTRIETDRGHGEHVARIAAFMGREMGLDENQLEDLSKAAMLHEVGLLFMSRPPLTDKEKKDNIAGAAGYDENLMRQYPVKGAELLSRAPGFERAARIIRSLNEWSDGTGYPDGLKRRYIPLASKILAGADELENLKASPDVKGPEELLAGLENLAGARLDPVIVGLLGKYVVTRMTQDAFKVRGVGIEQLEPGMVLGAALFTATGTKLFSAGTRMTGEAIDKIIQYSREYPVDETVFIKV